MAGTLFSLAMSQWRKLNGEPEVDAPLYVYMANTSTPVEVFQDFGLSVLHPWPLRTNSRGMIPPFWLPDGQYRARLTDNTGLSVYFDVPIIQTVGPSEGGGGGGGGGGVDPNAVHQTGDMIWKPVSGPRLGWVRANARTIGSATSGASERANADTQALYEYLWSTFSQELCPVTGGRGSSATGDFAANKPIATPDMRGRGPMGLDDMGNSAAGIITDGTPTAAGTSGGAEKKLLARSNLPNTVASVSVNITDPGHSHTYVRRGSAGTNLNSGPAPVNVISGTNSLQTTTNTTGITAQGSFNMNGNVAQEGLNVMSPYALGTWYLKL